MYDKRAKSKLGEKIRFLTDLKEYQLINFKDFAQLVLLSAEVLSSKKKTLSGA
jgi:hypothetical protein